MKLPDADFAIGTLTPLLLVAKAKNWPGLASTKAGSGKLSAITGPAVIALLVTGPHEAKRGSKEATIYTELKTILSAANCNTSVRNITHSAS